MYASVTTVSGGGPQICDVARMAADSLLTWLREFDGYKGLYVLADPEAGSARFVTLWDSREAAERSAWSRTQVRERMIQAAGVSLESVELLEVVAEDLV
jgi:heme-degrading monooxygenase HmoA